MHHIDADKTYWEKTKRELNKNATSHIKQIQRQHLMKQKLYDHLPPISKTLQIRRTKHEGHYWSSKHEIISDVLL